MIEDRVRTRHEDMVKMTRQIMEVGPQIGEVARRMEVFKETLRYRFHKYILQRGFVIQANLDYEKLGLKRLMLIAKVAPAFEQHTVTIMSVLNQTCYLTGVAETTLEGSYIMQVTVPSELSEECGGLYDRLHEAGVFSEMQMLRFEEARSVPMKPEYYDFSTGTWAYDWHGKGIAEGTLLPRRRAEVEKYDMCDLLILKELEIDANQTLVGIAKKLNISQKTVLYHYRSHVLRRGLIKNYKILWQDPRDNSQVGDAGSMPDAYMAVALLVRETTAGQRAKLAASLNQIPFLWFEACDPDYYAEFFVPVTSYIEFLRRIRALAVRTGMGPQVFMLDQSKTLRFTISYKLYNRREKSWELSATDVITRFDSLMVNVNKSRGVA
jgi:DNA-binding Lrp family transcriptional regulator